MSSASGSSQHSLDAVLGEITTQKDDEALNHYLRNYATKETRELIYASILTGGQDPLSVLDARNNTLGLLYLLSARVIAASAAAPPLAVLQRFCAEFNPNKARLAPERVTLLAKGIVARFEAANLLKNSLPLLYDLVTRYPPSLEYLTTLHAIFVRTCVATGSFTTSLPILSVPITEVDPLLSDLHYNDNLIYHYAGGMAFAALKRWAEAEEFFEIVVGSPAQTPAAIQLEALKKLALVQLISHGKLKDLPKYASALLLRLFKNSPYGAIVNAYPLQSFELEKILERDASTFEADKNVGLIKQVIERGRRWSVKNLTETYITLSLSEIAQAINIPEEEAVRAIVVSMIEEGEINGSISADGTVTFDDTPPTFTKQQVDAMLTMAQNHGFALSDLDRKMARSREFLSKALKNKDDNWSANADDEMYRMDRGGGWEEESLFT